MSKFDLGDCLYEIKCDGNKEILVRWKIESVHINKDDRYFLLKETDGNGIDIIDVNDVELCYFSEESIIDAMNLWHIGQQEPVEAA